MPACLPVPAWRGGTIAISGDVGERAGGILVGETLGMRGGVLTIGGNAGPLLGERMRRGLVIVERRCRRLCRRPHGRRNHSVQARRRPLRRLRLAPRQPDLPARSRRTSCRPSAIAACWSSTISGCLSAGFARHGKPDQARRSRAPADGRHVGARQGRDADPRLSEPRTLDVDASNAHMGYARHRRADSA